MDFLLATENLPFVIALLLMLGIALIEGVASVVGAGFSAALDALLPEFDADASLGADADQSGGLMSRLLGWLQVGKLPVLMVLIVLLTVYGLVGLGMQWVLKHSIGIMVSGWWLSIPALLVSLPIVQVCAEALHRFLPGDETEAVSEQSFIGRRATITLGRASTDNPAQARLRDAFGQSHYVMLQPRDGGQVFETGDVVRVVERHGAVYAAIFDKKEDDAI